MGSFQLKMHQLGKSWRTNLSRASQALQTSEFQLWPAPPTKTTQPINHEVFSENAFVGVGAKICLGSELARVRLQIFCSGIHERNPLSSSHGFVGSKKRTVISESRLQVLWKSIGFLHTKARQTENHKRKLWQTKSERARPFVKAT